MKTSNLDVQWEDAKRKAGMLGDMRRKEDLLKTKLADLKRKVLDQKMLPKNEKIVFDNLGPIVMPEDIIVTKVPKASKKKNENDKYKISLDTFEEMSMKAQKLDAIKLREQTLIQKLAMLKEKQGKKVKVEPALLETRPEIFEPKI